MAEAIDPRASIGHVHLKVSNLERSLAFYTGVLGFQITERYGESAAFVSAGGYHHHIGLNTWESRNGAPPPPGSTGLYHFAIRYPDRAALARAVKRVVDAGVRPEGASDHGVSEAVYLRDPDGNGIELYRDRPEPEWPRTASGVLHMTLEPLDLPALLAEAAAPALLPARAESAPLGEESRARLRDVRTRLLQLHKALLDDARAAYELDRGTVGTRANLLQLVIHDPWFAWLHQISELIVRIDEAASAEGVASEGDARTLMDQVDRLLVPSEAGDPFARRYFEALQRQPAVVLAHADVKRALKNTHS